MGVNGRYAEAVEAYEAGTVPADKGREADRPPRQGQPVPLAPWRPCSWPRRRSNAGKRDDAIATLRNLRDLDPDLRPVVRQRLARLLIDAGKAKEALPLLDDDTNPAMLDVRGDAQLALGERAQAQKAYLKALALVDVADPQHRLLDLETYRSGRHAAAHRGQDLMIHAPRRPLRMLAVATLAIAVLSGCTTVKNVFDGRGKDKSTDPTPLVQITPIVTVSKLWAASVGKGEDKLGIGQRPAIVDGRVYAAALEGGVSAFDLRTGQSLWRYASELP